ncbi:MAG: VWA domain-containing protein [Planctomycetia bacterium]|nr:VWA domain-containing protein [Planctomycetia bacterium]
MGTARGRPTTRAAAALLLGVLAAAPAVAAPPPELGPLLRKAASAAPDERRAALDGVRGLASVEALDVVVTASAVARRARDAAATRLAREGEALGRLYDERARVEAAFARRRAPDVAASERHRQRLDELRDRADVLEVATTEASRDVAIAEEELDLARRAAAGVLARLPAESLGAGLDRLAAAWQRAAGLASDDRIRYVEAIERVKDPVVAARLAALVADPAADPRLRAVALDARAARRDDGVLGEALAAVADPSWVVRAAAIDVLRTLHEPAAVPVLIAFLAEDGLGRLREDACRALRSLTGEPHGPYHQPWADWWDGARPTFEPPRRPASLAALVAPPTGVTFYGISTFSERVILVLDVSGSMAEQAASPGRAKGERKIDTARRELAAALDGLDERRARFGVVLFDRGVRRFGPGLSRADLASRGAARTWVAAHEPAGETNLFDALREAFRLASGLDGPLPPAGGADTVFLLTDGKPTAGGVVATDRILDAVVRWNRAARVTVHCVGVGAHDAGLLRTLSSLTGGQYVRR